MCNISASTGTNVKSSHLKDFPLVDLAPLVTVSFDHNRVAGQILVIYCFLFSLRRSLGGGSNPTFYLA